MGRPAISRNTFRGSLVEASRAGITPSVLTETIQSARQRYTLPQKSSIIDLGTGKGIWETHSRKRPQHPSGGLPHQAV